MIFKNAKAVERETTVVGQLAVYLQSMSSSTSAILTDSRTPTRPSAPEGLFSAVGDYVRR
jgi:hypothetical protein